MARRNREVEQRLLTKFEFSEAPNRESGHRWVELRLEGLPVIATYFSHARQDIGEDSTLWKMIARQLRVRRNFLNQMMDCTKSRDAYYKQVREEPYPPWQHRF
jgi:hypothetical protein